MSSELEGKGTVFRYQDVAFLPPDSWEGAMSPWAIVDSRGELR